MSKHPVKAAPADEYERLARECDATAKLLRSHGRLVAERTAGWKTGPRSPALQPSSGARYEPCDDRACAPECTNPVCKECPNPDSDDPADRLHVHLKHSHLLPSDSVGEHVADQAPPGAERLNAEYRVNLALASRALHRIRTITKQACRDTRDDAVTVKEETREEIAAAGFCVSCYRVDKTLNPIAKIPDRRSTSGERVLYAEFCRWCGDFVGEWKHIIGVQELPPIELVRVHLSPRKRVTEKQTIEVLRRKYRDRFDAITTTVPTSPIAGRSGRAAPTLEQRTAEHARRIRATKEPANG